ncbi:hypothetical protein [Halostagnicola sp. A-GB9-2]|uniref:hypothetical protein n=1 Tax=Halostagnicola sp. A-GB9-2 TaxID=3048066 RepID=UPI0024C00204|nr:hypothetical protein [Halostagnicola sp. A-GB9-2]MDJ1434712.1 hypothetical protein [Halostagnicola sp. A-GB9-2]
MTLSRRKALGVIGVSAVGIGSATAASAMDERAQYELEIDDEIVVDSKGEPIGADHDSETELFGPEPEFPPFVMHDASDVQEGSPEAAYLREHGASNLLESRRLVVHPEAAESRPLTWGEYETPELVEATVTAGGNGCSNVEITLDGLVPHGTYTMWVVHEPTYHRPLGGNDGDNNTFVVDEDGRGQISATDEPTELTLPPGATTDNGDEIPVTTYPLYDIDECMFVGAYHYDDRTWSSQPGPFMLTQFNISS